MDQNSNHQEMLKLISLLESLLASTQQSKVGIQAHSNEARTLLHGWVLPECQSLPETALVCQCLEAQKQQINTFLEKVEKAVKYSQGVREGRTDVTSPWQDNIEYSIQKSEVKKVISTKSGPNPRSLGPSREKFVRGRQFNGPSKRLNNCIVDNNSKLTVCSSEQLDQKSIVCPLHGDPQPEGALKTKLSHTVGLAEALDVKGIPPELVTVLKSVHHYINRLKTTTMKNRLEASFLRNLNSVNERSWDKFSSVSTLFKDLPVVTCRRKIPMLKEISSEMSLILKDKHLFMGIWNPTISSIISVGALCVQYQHEDMWHLLQNRIQQLQLSHVEWQLCDVLSCNPLLFNPDLDYQAASLFLKAATALSRLTTLNLPVLVQTYRET